MSPELGEHDHRRAGLDDLSGFGVDCRDDAVLVGFEHRIAGGVGRLARLSFSRFERRLRGIGFELALVDRRLGRVALGQQRLRPREGVLGDGEACLGGGDRGAGAVLAEDKIGIVEPRNDLPGLDLVAGIDETLDDLAGDAEAERTFSAGFDFAGEGLDEVARLPLHHDRLDGADDMLGRRLLLARRQPESQDSDANQTEG